MGGQPEALAAVAFVIADLVELLEPPLLLRFRNALAAVLYRQHRHSAGPGHRQRDAAVRGVLDGIVDQVANHAREQHGVGVDYRRRLRAAGDAQSLVGDYVRRGDCDIWLSTYRPGPRMSFYNLYMSATYDHLGAGGNFFLTDDSDAVAPGILDVRIITRGSDGRTVRLVNPTPETFIGFVGFGVVDITVVPVDSQYHVTANNFTLAPAVPEPGTYAMLLAGLGTIGGLAARRRANARTRPGKAESGV